MANQDGSLSVRGWEHFRMFYLGKKPELKLTEKESAENLSRAVDSFMAGDTVRASSLSFNFNTRLVYGFMVSGFASKARRVPSIRKTAKTLGLRRETVRLCRVKLRRAGLLSRSSTYRKADVKGNKWQLEPPPVGLFIPRNGILTDTGPRRLDGGRWFDRLAYFRVLFPVEGSGLTWQHSALFGLLLWRVGKQCSVEWCRLKLGLAKRTVKGLLADLQRLGLVKIDINPGGFRVATLGWTALHFQPKPKRDKASGGQAAALAQNRMPTEREIELGLLAERNGLPVDWFIEQERRQAQEQKAMTLDATEEPEPTQADIDLVNRARSEGRDWDYYWRQKYAEKGLAVAR